MNTSQVLTFDQKCRKVTKNNNMHNYDWLIFDTKSMCELVGIEYTDYQQWCDEMGQDKVRAIRNSGVPEKYEWNLPIPQLRDDLTKDSPGMFSIPDLKIIEISAKYWNNEKVLKWLNTVRIVNDIMYW